MCWPHDGVLDMVMEMIEDIPSVWLDNSPYLASVLILYALHVALVIRHTRHGENYT